MGKARGRSGARARPASAELGLAQRAFEGREEVRDGLGVVPDVGAGAVAAARVVAAAFPAPEPAVGLAQDGGRFEDREVGGDGFDDFRRQRGVVEAVAEASAVRAQSRRSGSRQ